MTSSQNLTEQQRKHVAKVYPECRQDMTHYLHDGVEVGIRRQSEVGEAPAYAIYVTLRPEFWIDCCHSHAKAARQVEALGLRLQK